MLTNAAGEARTKMMMKKMTVDELLVDGTEDEDLHELIRIVGLGGLRIALQLTKTLLDVFG